MFAVANNFLVLIFLRGNLMHWLAKMLGWKLRLSQGRATTFKFCILNQYRACLIIDSIILIEVNRHFCFLSLQKSAASDALRKFFGWVCSIKSLLFLVGQSQDFIFELSKILWNCRQRQLLIIENRLKAILKVPGHWAAYSFIRRNVCWATQNKSGWRVYHHLFFQFRLLRTLYTSYLIFNWDRLGQVLVWRLLFIRACIEESVRPALRSFRIWYRLISLTFI